MKLSTSLMIEAVVKLHDHAWIDAFQNGDFDAVDLEYHFYNVVRQNKIPNLDLSKLPKAKLAKIKALAMHIDFDLGAHALAMWDGLDMANTPVLRRAGVARRALQHFFIHRDKDDSSDFAVH
ncbi:hypothetical protein [Vibrio thalassae]